MPKKNPKLSFRVYTFCPVPQTPKLRIINHINHILRCTTQTIPHRIPLRILPMPLKPIQQIVFTTDNDIRIGGTDLIVELKKRPFTKLFLMFT